MISEAFAINFTNDIWDINDLPIPADLDRNNRTHISFEKITHPWLNHMAKEYIIFLATKGHSISSIVYKISNLSDLSKFMEDNHFYTMKNFTHLNTLNYIGFINKIRPSAYYVHRHLANLNVFVQWGTWTHPEQFPTQQIVKHTYYPKRIRKEPEYYTDNELKKIKSILPYVDKLTARITLVMMLCGVRFSDISKTPLNIEGRPCLVETSDHQFNFEYYMSKVKRYNRIPVTNTVAKIIQAQINSTTKHFGNDCKYLFAFRKNRLYNYQNYVAKMDYHLNKHGVKRDNGKPFRINTSLFRKTYATSLINNGVPPDTIRAMLGHKGIYTQMHYATIHGEKMLSLLAPLTQQDNDLIERIGNVTESMCHVPDDYSDFVPLPNGACTCAGDCPHQNACYTCHFYVPQKDFLSAYKLQLKQAELAIAEARKYNHTSFLEKNVALRNALKSIIDKLEADIHETG